MSIYKAIASLLDGRQITFPDSIHLIIEAMTPGNDIFDKTGEIRVVWESLEAVTKKSDNRLSGFSTSTEWHGIPAQAS